MSQLEAAVKQLQDSLIVISEIERRQSALLREHSELIVSIERNLASSAKIQQGTDFKLQQVTVKLEEVTDKLNGLIGFVGGM